MELWLTQDSLLFNLCLKGSEGKQGAIGIADQFSEQILKLSKYAFYLI
jgi:hypothetical protein